MGKGTWMPCLMNFERVDWDMAPVSDCLCIKYGLNCV
jgi:hypothetical protein